MQKRGQFFLIASLVLITIVLSLGTIYNKITYIKQPSKLYNLANDIKYESMQIIDNSVYKVSAPETREARLNALASSYHQSNYNTDIYLINGTDTSPTYSVSKNGNPDNSITIIRNNNKITATLPSSLSSLVYEFEIRKGYNIFVIALKQNDEERTISYA